MPILRSAGFGVSAFSSCCHVSHGSQGRVIWPLAHVGEYEGEVVAAKIVGDERPANYEAVPRVTYKDPQAAEVGAVEAPDSATAPISAVPKTATYTHAYAGASGFLSCYQAASD